MKIKKLLTAVTGMVLLLSAPCFANEISVIQDIETTKVTVYADLGEGYKNKKLMMYCLSDDESVSDISREDDTVQKTDKICAISYGVAGADGKYEFSDIVVNGESGKYVFYVTAGEKGTVFKSNSEFIINSAAVEAFSEAISNASKEEILSVIDDEIKNKNIGINITLYENLNDTAKDKAAQMLQNREFGGIKEIESEINRVSVKPGIEYAWSAKALDMLLYPDDYPELSEFADVIKAENEMDSYKDNVAVQTLSKLGASVRTNILDRALKINTGESLFNRIEISVINHEISSCDGYGDVGTVISRYKDSVLKNLDFSKYDRSRYKNIVNKELLTKSFNSASELVTYIETALKNAEKNDTYKPSPGGGGGGGGGGGSSSGQKTPAAISPDITAGENVLAPKNNVSVNVSFEDMSGFDWAKPAVEYLAEKGIVSGRTSNSFDPSGLITREEFVKIIVCAFGIEVTGHDSVFSDVEPGAWYEKYISAAVDAGVINGVSDYEFGTGRNVTRQDVAVIAARAVSAPVSDEATVFSDDNQISEYAKASVAWMYENGYIGGYEDKTFKPSNPCTRAEAAKIIYEIINN